MVTEEAKRELPLALNSSPLRYTPEASPKLVIATGTIADADRFKLAQIRPRDGRTSNYLKWLEDVEQLYLAHGITPHNAKQSPPLVTELPEGKLATRADTERSLQQRDGEPQCVCDEPWLACNTRCSISENSSRTLA